MSKHDNRGNVAIWPVDSDNPKAPVARGVVTAHRDIREGEEIEIALWNNHSDNPKAPRMTGKISDRKPKDDGPRDEDVNQDDGPPEDYNDEIPF